MKFYVFLPVALLCSLPAIPQLRPPAYSIDTLAGSRRDGDNGPAILAQLSRIQGIAADRFGNLYLSDTDHHRVRKISPAGVITTVAGTGLPGYSGDSGPASQAQLDLPYGLAADLSGGLYIADLGNNRIRRVWPDGVITTVAPSVSFATPRNLALDDAGNLYVSEFDAHRIRRIAPDGSAKTIVGTGRAGFSGDGGPPESAQLSYPCGIAIDRGGALLIADSGNNRVRKIFSNGILNTILGGSGGTVLATPVAVAVDAQNNIYVADAAAVVRSYSVNGRWSDAAGSSVPGFSGDGGPAIRATVASVRDLSVDAASNLFLADGLRIRRVDVMGVINTIGGDAYVHAIGDGGPALHAVLFRPSSVALDSAGNLLIADTGTQRVRQVASGQIATVAGTGVAAPSALSEPMAAVADSTGNIYIADTGNNAVRVIGSDRRLRTLISGVQAPRGLCLSRTGVLHIVDTGNGRVLRMTSVTATVASQLTAPEACALDDMGNLYIAETGAHRVRRVSPSGESAVIAGHEDLSFPRGIAVDAAGNVYVSDTGGNRIRLITPDGSIQTIAGTGEPGYTGDGGDALRARLNAPAGLWVDSAGDLYVADSLNDRIRRLQPAGLADELVAPVRVVNALSGEGGAVAPGELVRIQGAGSDSQSAMEIRVGGRAVPLLQSFPEQLIVQIPEDVAPRTTLHLEVRCAGKPVGGADLAVAEASPGLLAIAFNQDGTPNTNLHPASTGGSLAIFATGYGKLESARPVLPISVTIAGVPAEVTRAEAAAGATGLIVIVVRIPGGFIPSGEATLQLSVGGVEAKPLSVWLP